LEFLAKYLFVEVFNDLIQFLGVETRGDEINPFFRDIAPLLTAVENGGAGTVSRRSKMAAHNRAVLWEVRIGATAPITPPFRERHRSAHRHGDLERDTT
jgi:hypothetical protein